MSWEEGWQFWWENGILYFNDILSATNCLEHSESWKREKTTSSSLSFLWKVTAEGDRSHGAFVLGQQNYK